MNEHGKRTKTITEYEMKQQHQTELNKNEHSRIMSSQVYICAWLIAIIERK